MRLFFIIFREMHFNALLKRVTPQNVKSIFRYNISTKQLISFRYNGKLCSLAHLKEIFHIGGEGRNLTPRPLYGTFLIVHSKYVRKHQRIWNLVFCVKWQTPTHYLHNVLGFFSGKHQRIFHSLE